jgi:hypothetical protein
MELRAHRPGVVIALGGPILTLDSESLGLPRDSDGSPGPVRGSDFARSQLHRGMPKTYGLAMEQARPGGFNSREATVVASPSRGDGLTVPAGRLNGRPKIPCRLVFRCAFLICGSVQRLRDFGTQLQFCFIVD